MIKHILFAQKTKKYQGKYIATKGDRVVASGKDAKEAYYLAKKILEPQKPEGVYYIPSKKDLQTALCVFLTSN